VAASRSDDAEHLSRRRFLGLTAAGTLAFSGLPGCSGGDGPNGSASRDALPATGGTLGGGAGTGLFPDGVMAGDPRPDGAVIWTRVDPTAAVDTLRWEVAEDDRFSSVVVRGTVTPDPARHSSVQVAVAGLEPDRWYHYRFVADGGAPEGTSSRTGRLRTAPAPGTSPERLTFAWCSCQQINDSLYVAHRAMAHEEDLDFFIHLGDYVYVSDTGTLSLDDYRAVYDRFKANPLLQDLQARVPIVAMFDDGEFYNGVDRTGDPARLAAARTAWFEAFPVQPPPGEPHRAYRRLSWGDLVELFMVDVRSYRDPEIPETDTATPEGARILEPGRTTLGAEQKAWLLDGLRSSTAAWKVLGNPYNMTMTRVVDADPGPPRPPGAQVNAGSYFPNEAWDDYSAERREVLEAIVAGGVRDVVSVSGHTHVWIAGLLQPDPDDPASPVAAFDFTCGSLTADPDVLAEGDDRDAARASNRTLEAAGLAINPHLRYLNLVDQGYGLARVTRDRIEIEFKLIDPFDEAAEAAVGARFSLTRGADDMTAERFSAAER